MAEFYRFVDLFGMLWNELMVPRRGLEPPRPCERRHLKTVRLPIPPSGHMAANLIVRRPGRRGPLAKGGGSCQRNCDQRIVCFVGAIAPLPPARPPR